MPVPLFATVVKCPSLPFSSPSLLLCAAVEALSPLSLFSGSPSNNIWTIAPILHLFLPCVTGNDQHLKRQTFRRIVYIVLMARELSFENPTRGMAAALQTYIVSPPSRKRVTAAHTAHSCQPGVLRTDQLSSVDTGASLSNSIFALVTGRPSATTKLSSLL